MAGKRNKYIAALLGVVMMITGCGNQSPNEEEYMNQEEKLTSEASFEDTSASQTANNLNTDLIKSEKDSAIQNDNSGQEVNSETSSISNQLNQELEEEREFIPDCDSGDTGYNPEHYDLDIEQKLSEYGYTDCEDFRKDILGRSIEVFRYGYSSDQNIVMSPYSVINSLSIVLLGISDTDTYAGSGAMTSWFRNGTGSDPNYVLSGIKELNLKFISQYEYQFSGQLVTTCSLNNASGLSKFNTEYVCYENGEDPYIDINSIVQKSNGHIVFSGDSVIYNTAVLSIGYFEDSWITEADWYISDHEFHNQDGTTVLPHMAMFTENLDYIETDSAYGLIKPFSHDDDYSMVIIMPKQGSLDSFIDSLEVEDLDSLMESRSNKNVSFIVPSFTSSSEIELNGFMEQEGLGGVVGQDASFYSLTSDDMKISQILHKTYFSLNGRGARSYDNITDTNSENDVRISGYPVICDKPFLYIIIDNDTGIPVIMGAVNNL